MKETIFDRIALFFIASIGVGFGLAAVGVFVALFFCPVERVPQSLHRHASPLPVTAQDKRGGE